MELINKISGILCSFHLSTFHIHFNTLFRKCSKGRTVYYFHTKTCAMIFMKGLYPLFLRRPHVVAFEMKDICCCYKTESLKSTPEALERWDRVKIPRCAVHLQMLSTECNLASSRTRRLSVVLVFKIVLTSSKTSSAGHKFCSPENTTFIVVSLFLVSDTV